MSSKISNTVFALIKGIFIIGIISSLAACGSKKTAKPACNEGSECGVGDTMRFYGNDLSSEQERQSLGKNTYYFDYDSYGLSEQDTLSLHSHAKKAIAQSKTKIRIEGHTDERGSREYNVALGERRAKTISNTLMMKGVSPEQINVVSYGKEKPAAAGHDESAWKQNRRGVVVYEAE